MVYPGFRGDNRRMEAKLLKAHKQAAKRLIDLPPFKATRRGRLPKPLDKLGGSRWHATEMLPVGAGYQACFVWRDGQLLADTCFYAWLFEQRPTGLSPLAGLHYHPSHKPVHLVTPCRLDRDFTNRALPVAIEFVLAHERFDPRRESDRSRLVALFCERCGIALGASGGLLQ